MAAVTTLIGTLKKVFSDVKEIRWKDGDISTANLASVTWDKQLPVLTDGLDFNMDDPTTNQVKVFGLKRAWASATEDGDCTMTLQIPSIAEGVVGWLWDESAASVTTASEEINGETGSFSGKGYTLTTKKLDGTLMIISGDAKYAMIIRHLEAVTSFAFSDPKSNPFAITLTCTLSGDVETENATNDFDLAFLEWSATA